MSENLKAVDETVDDKLLRLIENGDATVILSSEYSESLNELMKKELITIENDELMLTEKGRQAQIHGVNAEIDHPIEQQVTLSDFTIQELGPGISNRAFFFILFFFLISLLLTVTYIYNSTF